MQEPLLPHKYHNTRTAFLYMLFGSVTMGFMSMTAKLIRMRSSVSPLHLTAMRGMGMAIGAFCFCKVCNIDHLKVPKPIATYFIFRCIFGFLSVISELIALYLLPFSLAIILNFTQPIAVTIINFVFLGEKLKVYEYVSICVTMIGVVILTSPSNIFWSIEQSDNLLDYPNYKYGVMIALFGSCSSGFAYLMMRKIGANIDSAINPLYFGIFLTFAGMIATKLADHALPELDWPTIGLIVVFCFFGWVAQVGVSKAVQLEKGGRVAAVLYI